jgi:hypothetical protein
MTSDVNWSPSLRRIGEIELPDHYYLSAEDECYFFGEYIPRGDSPEPAWKLSVTNKKISNLKKHPSKSGTNGKRRLGPTGFSA